MAIQSKHVEYRDGDTVLEGYVAWDDAVEGERPCVLVSHAWAGRGQFENDKAEALAGLGYAGFALDLYGKGVLGTSTEENSALMQPFLDDRASLLRRLMLAVEAARAEDVVDASSIGAIGFCFGGLCVLDLARSGADLKGVVAFHGLFGPPDTPSGKPITAKVLALHGWDDPMVPPESVVALAAELTQAGADWQIHGYGHTLHAFTNPAANDPEHGTVYSADADRRSWTAMQDFLDEVMA